MSELRQNRITGEWVVMAAERGSRPSDFRRSEEKRPLPRRKENCPFCPGNESYTPKEAFAYRKKGTRPDTDGWSVRIVPNKFPALSPETDAAWFQEIEFFTGVKGYGHHDVLIETPRHDESIATMSLTQARKVFRAYRSRHRELERRDDILLVTIFRNHGRGAGASLEHPHSQILATPVIPARIQERLRVAREYYSEKSRCIFCDMLSIKKDYRERVVLSTEGFVAFQPYASQAPFETWIAPRRHRASFGDLENDELDDLAAVARDILRRMHFSLGDPDYNYVIQSNPPRTKLADRYHWYLQIVPRVNSTVGFELSSGIYITTARPEDTAAFLRGADPRL